MALNIKSYNCEGVKRNRNYISSLLNSDKLDILCLQETWLLDSNICIIGELNSNFLYTGVSGVDMKKTF